MPPVKRRGVQKPKNAIQAVKRLLSFTKDFKALWVAAAVCVALDAGAAIFGTYLLKPAINNFIVPLATNQSTDFASFSRLLAIMGAVYALGAVSSYLNNRIMLLISTNTLLKIRTALFAKMETLPLKYFDSRTHGELMSLYTNDTDTIRDMLSQSVPRILNSALSIAGVFAMMIVLSPILCAEVLVFTLIMVFVIKNIGKRSAESFRENQKNIASVNGYIEEIISGQKVVKVFNHEDASREAFAEVNEKLRKAGTRANTWGTLTGPVSNNIGHIQYAAVAFLSAILVIKGRLSIGAAASFLQYTRNFNRPINEMSQLFNGILNALAGAERIFQAIDEESEDDSGDFVLVNAQEVNQGGKIVLEKANEPTGIWAWQNKKNGELVRLQGSVNFENVSFSYVREKEILHSISLSAKPGEKIALVGSTGSGKTTVLNLLSRFYDLEDGEGIISFDTIPIKNIRRSSLRRALGMVLQDTHLFSGTIEQNILYGAPKSDKNTAIQAAKTANADNFIRHLASDYETMLSADGGNLSAGQRQLLSIARAAAANPPVLVLDEATSSVDTRTESLIEKAMAALMEGRTVFVIAHRLSTVRNADCIIVLENGNIIERGNHEELIAKKGRYYELYTGAFELS